jgi:hypothetical protein
VRAVTPIDVIRKVQVADATCRGLTVLQLEILMHPQAADRSVRETAEAFEALTVAGLLEPSGLRSGEGELVAARVCSMLTGLSRPVLDALARPSRKMPHEIRQVLRRHRLVADTPRGLRCTRLGIFVLRQVEKRARR